MNKEANKSRLGYCYAKNSSKSGMYLSRSASLHFLNPFLPDFFYFFTLQHPRPFFYRAIFKYVPAAVGK